MFGWLFGKRRNVAVRQTESTGATPKPATNAQVGPPLSRAKENAIGVMQLYCPRCGGTYRLGENATVTTMGQIFGLARGVIGAASDMNAALSSPDLVGSPARNESCPPVAAQLAQTMQEVEIIRADLARGRRRSWYCEKCDNDQEPYPYPTGK